MSSGIPTVWKRLTAMSGDEVRTRVLQAISKRVDLAVYRAGVGSRPCLLSPNPSSEAKFFFGANDVQNRAALLRAHLPKEADAIIRDADEICRHEFRLLGCEKMNLGEQIDWHLSRGKRDHQLKPWYKINFLDFNSVGDHKLVWELNRHQHLVTLAKAWNLTSNAAYVTEIVAQWYSWQKANPYPLGINWASTLEAAFRSISWLWVRNLLGECAELPANFPRDLLLALQLHGRHIERYLSTYFSPNTHLLGEAVALFFIGTSCPEIAASRRWRELGLKIILAESERQVRPDGVHFEQSLYYHVYALDFFLHARILAAENGVAIPAQFDDVLKKMLDFIQELSAAGAVEGFGDDDGGRVFNPRRNRAECMTDPLAIGAAMFGRTYASARLTEESIWLLGDKAIQFFEKPRAATSVLSRAFPASGIYLMSDCEPYPQQLMIDAGPQGSGSCGHGHADALSVRLLLQGRRFLIEPGTFCYVSAGEERNQFRGTGAHNTLRIDSVDQAVPDGPFAWSSLPKATAETWLNGQTFDFFVGSHDGYKRLPEPVLHR
ncbi:MAG: alginate lyase family protein, partial [Candidatus Sulfotelmatobacter sp.]